MSRERKCACVCICLCVWEREARSKTEWGRVQAREGERGRGRGSDIVGERWLRGAAPHFIRQHTAALQCDHTVWVWGYEIERKKAERSERDKRGGGSYKEELEGFAWMRRGGGWTVSLLAVVDVRRTWRQWLSLRQIVGLLCRSSQREDAMPCEQWGVACVSQEQLLWLHLRCLRVSDRQGMQQTSALSTEAASCTQQGEEPGGLGREWGAPASGRSYLNRHCGPAVILASESRGSPAICWIWTWIYCFQRWEARSLA